MKTDFNRWKDEDDSDAEGDNPYNDDNLNAVSRTSFEALHQIAQASYCGNRTFRKHFGVENA